MSQKRYVNFCFLDTFINAKCHIRCRFIITAPKTLEWRQILLTITSSSVNEGIRRPISPISGL